MQKTSINVQYNVPRVYVQAPGKQNRLLDGEFQITPGFTEVVQFHFGNQDGVPLNLVPFQIKFVVWDYVGVLEPTVSLGQSDIILAKTITVDDPYSGIVEMKLTAEDTLQLGLHTNQAIRWSLFAINQEGEVFPMQVARGGTRYGQLRMDLTSGMPSSELIKSA